MTETTISETEYERPDGEKQRQYRTTVPKQLVEALDLAGETVEWDVESANRLSMRVVDE